MKVAYVVSRFPHVSETFIVRELDAVAQEPGIDLELFSLFRAVDPTVHPSARRWVARLRRTPPPAAAQGFLWWLARRPVRLLGSSLLAALGAVRRPAILLRTLATLPIAAAKAREIRALGVDHIHAHWATYPALTAWMCTRLTGIPYSFTAHAHDLYVDRSFLAVKVRDARFVVTISDYNRRVLRAFGGDRDTPVHVVRCGVDPDAYAFRPRATGPGPVQALCVASLRDYKGHRTLLEALALGDPRIDRVHLWLAGDGPLRDSLETLARRLGLEHRVDFLGGRTEPEVADLLARADLFVLPSVVARDGLMEGLPVALIEALAAGVPTVTTRLSGIPELVRDGETGLLAEPSDAAGLASALARTLADSDAAVERAAAGRRLVEAEFDVRTSGARLAALFRESAPPVSGDGNRPPELEHYQPRGARNGG